MPIFLDTQIRILNHFSQRILQKKDPIPVRVLGLLTNQKKSYAFLIAVSP